METKWLKRELLRANEGQIEGLPSNPRFIRDEKFEKLKKSIEEDPEFMQVRPLAVFPFDGAYVIVGGNMRFRACEWDELPCVVLPEDTPVEKLKRFVIKDNAAFGQWDFDALANEWDAEDVKSWGVDGLDNVDWDNLPLIEEQEPPKLDKGVVIAIHVPDEQKDCVKEIEQAVNKALEPFNLKIK